MQPAADGTAGSRPNTGIASTLLEGANMPQGTNAIEMVPQSDGRWSANNAPAPSPAAEQELEVTKNLPFLRERESVFSLHPLSLTGNFCYSPPFLGGCFNITGQEPIEVPELWPCVVSG
jgi:hypothetical protein